MAALHEALESTGAPFMIIGGIAVIVRGVPRLTQDIDATIWGEDLDLETLIEKLSAYGILSRIDDVVRFARQRQVLLLRHEPSGTPMEVSLAWLPFEAEALGRATEEEFAGVHIRVAHPEDLVVLKAVAWRDRDRSDIERLLLLHAGNMDIERIRGIVAQFAEVLEEPERVDQFDAILARVTDE